IKIRLGIFVGLEINSLVNFNGLMIRTYDCFSLTIFCFAKRNRYKKVEFLPFYKPIIKVSKATLNTNNICMFS
ncbi:hypothetical protein DD595_25655, partial [Enterobacter cloacae complex sp. 4DZ3-17B2]|uniref:hypothetical protein n=1 Tax=Enterobacter cloacae complex sp. 4DZ3-17B2 TaxID=2511990 RepID=UPI001026C726